MRDQLETKYEAGHDHRTQLKTALHKETETALSSTPHIDHITFRVKNTESFLNKALDPKNQPPYDDALVEIEDQIAGRIITLFLEDLQHVEDKLRGTYTTIESTRRRPDKDQEFGYESHHLICTIPPHLKPPEWNQRNNMPNTFELQIRTLFMHAWAEPQHHLQYKTSHDLSTEAKRELAWTAASAWGADQSLQRILHRQQKEAEKN